jgi:hypothetical protein
MLFRQGGILKDAPQDISGCHEKKLRASQLCRYHANCKRLVERFNNKVVYKDMTLHKIA